MTKYGDAANHVLQGYLGLEEVYAQSIQFKPFPTELIEAALIEVVDQEE